MLFSLPNLTNPVHSEFRRKVLNYSLLTRTLRRVEWNNYFDCIASKHIFIASTIGTRFITVIKMSYTRQHDWEEDRRMSVQAGQQILQSASDSIARSHTIAIETENIGNEVLSDLTEQRESLLRSRAQVNNMQSGIKRSNQIIASMTHHILYNKILLILIIILEVIILGCLVYVNFIRKK